jgi:hypothetical protein
MLGIMLEIFFDALGLANCGRVYCKERNEHQNTTSPQGYNEKETSENGVLRHFVSSEQQCTCIPVVGGQKVPCKHNKTA